MIDIELSPAPSHSPPSDEKASSSRPTTLIWTNLVKTVPPPPAPPSLLKSSIAGSGDEEAPMEVPTDKTILTNISGTATPGSLVALMGPSGSGKTTLLDCLAGRSSITGGSITINGQPLAKKHKRAIAYVTQQDVFFGHLSVRDQLLYTALLRLSDKLPFSAKIAEVDKIIGQLKLEKCARTPIMLVSGGEKKRCNIGTELLTDPSVILLDEPTSGLDSTSAVALMTVLRDLTSQGKTILTSIHQPSSSVFANFTNLIVLADGHMVYSGTPSGSLEYFAKQGHPCPGGYNAADHLMDLLVTDSGVEEPPKKKLIEAWDSKASASEASALLSSLDVIDDDDEITSKSKWNTRYTTQLKVLIHRAMRNSRSAIFTPMNFIKSFFLGVIAGLVWLQLPEGETYVVDRAGFMFFAMTFWVFDSMFTAMMTFPAERAVIFRERSSGSYRLSAYFIGKTVSEAPMRLTLPFIYLCVSYWMARLNDDFGVFVQFMIVQLLCVIAGESIGLLIGATIMDMEKAMVVGTLTSLAMMLTGGFFRKDVDQYIGWVQYLSPFKYSYHACVQIGFSEDVECDGSGVLESLCEEDGTGTVEREDIWALLGATESIAFNIGMLIVMSIVCRFLAYLSLRRMKGGRGAF